MFFENQRCPSIQKIWDLWENAQNKTFKDIFSVSESAKFTEIEYGH